MKILRHGSAAIALIALSGCQALGLPSFGLHSRAPADRWAPSSDYRAALDDGRAQLRDGNLSAAAALLRVAQQDPALRAEASNALGVTYARLGRDDLAERYFRVAVDIAPGDQRFAANLLRLQAQGLSSPLGSRDVQLASTAERAIPGNATQPVLREVNIAAADPVETTRGFTFIRTSTDTGSKPPILVALNTANKAAESKDQPGKASVESIADEASAKPAGKSVYPVRIDLAQTQSKSVYPLRIHLDR